MLNTARLQEAEWELMQRKTYTAWANTHLHKRDLSLHDLRSEFESACDRAFSLHYVPSLLAAKCRLDSSERASQMASCSSIW